ncbi:radical SAM/SPASM domain-containing protein [Candidatus Omnitrophota bacterium]
MHLRMVEIEIHNSCNRKCVWCPKSLIEKSKEKIFPAPVFTKILRELGSLGYRGTVSFSRYNEPLMNAGLLESRINEVRQVLPNAKIVFNTNGDFLLSDSFNRLDADEITIMDYDGKGIKKCLEIVEKIEGAKILSIKYPYVLFSVRSPFSTRLTYGLYYIDWVQNALIEDRGGLLKPERKTKRTFPCFEPSHFIGIDCAGDVVPCCQIISDYVDHRKFILGNIKHKSLMQIWRSKKALRFRNRVKRNDFPECCITCQKKEGRYTRKEPSISYFS